MSDPRGACKCALLEREVAALERLVGRYQQELVASASCGACGKRAHASLPAEEDELFERQQLDALRWDEESGAMVQLTRRNGQPCGFDAVELPSCEWIWTSDWHIAVTSKTDGNGWTYASSHEDIDTEVACQSDRMIDHRVRRRRWKRQRKFIGSADLPQATWSTLDSEARLCALQHANEKLTEQLRRANDRILEYEDRLKAYEAKLLEMQNTTPLKRPPRIVTTIKPHDPSLLAALPFSPSKSRDVLHQTEALLSQLLGTTEPVLLNEETREAQRRRSQMVMECQSELDGAVTEFHSLVQTMDCVPRRTTSQPTLGA